ncbi:MAG TPA: PQQ-binding-like beta-propeller repeat protein [Candidatus Limnocylindria bacterium]|nr:PQQ-binding-like beta-propeller repeat protein [Candidatus Limnocylindria bacterium]
MEPTGTNAVQTCSRVLLAASVLGFAAVADAPRPSPALVTAASDWPMFRGNPALTGVSSTELPDKLALKWSFKTGGPVSSSAAIVGGKVFVASESSNIFCLNLATGAQEWVFVASGPIESSPLVLDGRLYVGDSNTNFYCLDAKLGKPLWQHGFDDKIKSSPNWVASPDGKTRSILVGGYDFRLYSFAADTGTTNWTFETENYINGSPALGDGLTAFGGCDALIHVVDALKGTKVKEVPAGAYVAQSGALVGGRLYVAHFENEFLCVDLNKGEVAWRYKDRAFPFMSSPAVTADKVVVGSRDKRLHCIAREDGKPLWTFPTRGKVESSPVVAGDKVIVGSDDGRLYMVSLQDGHELWNYEIGQPIDSSPAIAANRVVVGASDGTVYCFGAP